MSFFAALLLLLAIFVISLDGDARTNALARQQGCHLEGRGFHGYVCVEDKP